jgi:hypothetical protein
MKFTKGVIVFLISILIPITCGLITALPILFIGNLYSSGFFVKWQYLGSPPEKAIKIVGLCNEEICVETENNKVYMFDAYICGEEAAQSCWEQVDALLIEKPEIIESCWYKFPDKNPPPTTIQNLVTSDCGSGGASQTNYALLKDGSIWVLENSTTDLQGTGLIILAFPFGVISFIIGSIIAVYKMPAVWRKWTKTSL